MACKHFSIAELVAPEILAQLTEPAAWRLIPEKIQSNLDGLREAFGDVIRINSGVDIYSGVRPVNCTSGAPHSRHKLTVDDVCAFDCHVLNLGRFRALVTSQNMNFGIVRMENPDSTPDWAHLEFSDSIVHGHLDIFIP
jgi:hypothetical protein